MGQYTKYQRLKQQITYDGGVTWQDVFPPVYGKGDVIEAQSYDCGYVKIEWLPDGYVCIEGTTTDYRWRWSEQSSQCCIDNVAYWLSKRQVSTDGGTTWSDVSPTEYCLGDEMDNSAPYAVSCAAGTETAWQTRWVATGSTVCDGSDRKNVEKEQISSDGVSWIDTGSFRTGSIVESQSIEC